MQSREFETIRREKIKENLEEIWKKLKKRLVFTEEDVCNFF